MNVNKNVKTGIALLASVFLLASCTPGGEMSSPQKVRWTM